MTLPIRFWCHGARYAPDASEPLLDSYTAGDSRDAVRWVREAVRTISADLDRAAFHTVWAWLGDHCTVQRAVAALHDGEPYEFAIETSTGRREWTAHLVRELPLATPCGCSPPSGSRPLSHSVTGES
ncbi:protein of unknown function [Streptomyces murinus]